MCFFVFIFVIAQVIRAEYILSFGNFKQQFHGLWIIVRFLGGGYAGAHH